MKIKNLIKSLPEYKIIGNKNIEVENIAYHSKNVRENFLFVCIKGNKFDGHNFIYKAIKSGANSFVVEKEFNLSFTQVLVPDSRLALALISTEFFEHPSNDIKLIGVTGTNGKTTTTYLIESILKEENFTTAILGTIGNKINNVFYKSKLTTLESYDLQRTLKKIKDLKTNWTIMEVSSHSLALKRIYGCEFDIGVFTNITQDHLDFHCDLEEYLNCKLKLFETLPKMSRKRFKAIVNLDDKHSKYIISKTFGDVITYGLNKKADFFADEIKINSSGINFVVNFKGTKEEISLGLTGLFNVYNALAAITTCYSEGVSFQKIRDGLKKVKKVSGRLEKINMGQKFQIFVDYAHTPDGLENLLKSARMLKKGKVILVFGCGGDRDRKKRPMMGKIAAKFSDYTIITSDNPRSEEVEKIIREIECGFLKIKNSDYTKEIDRFQAIKKAIYLARENDIVLIAGKGHENYQIFRDKIIHFDDREVCREILKERLKSD